MGYKIQYGVSKHDKSALRKRQAVLVLGIVLFCVIITALVAFPDQVTEIRRIVFPAFEPEVKQAFQNMLDHIGEGTDVSDAAAAFCKEIIMETTH